MQQLIFVLILINCLIYSAIFIYVNQNNFVAFLNTGQGGGVLIKDGNNHFLYDVSANGAYVLRELKDTLPFFVKTLDILFISHPDKDHYLGVFDLLKRYKLRLVILSTTTSDDYLYQKFLSLLKEKRIPFIVLKRGSSLQTNNFHFFILNPPNNDNQKIKDNDKSLVLKIQGKHSYLLTADIEKKAIDSLLACCRQFLISDYLLVPHHGSKYSLDESFYKAVQPKEVVIQVGRNNRYKHPHQQTLDFLYNLGFINNLWRTDYKGRLLITEI